MKNKITSFTLTIFILILANILMTTLFPAFGLGKFRLALNVLIVMYFSLKENDQFLPILIVLTQYFHSFFTIEGWELGTISAIIISIIISSLREVIHLSSAVMVMIISQVFQLIWFMIISTIFYVKLQNFDFLLNKFYRFIPESLTLSLLAPFIFIILDRIWKKGSSGMLGDEG